MFVSFLSRYPSDTVNQIYSNSKTRIWNLVVLVLILCTASFQICLGISPCFHQFFAHYNSIAPQKISTLGGLSLVSSWKLVCFIILSVSSFCYLQDVDFKGSHKNGIKSSCSEYRHYQSYYLLSSIQQSWVTYWLS